MVNKKDWNKSKKKHTIRKVKKVVVPAGSVLQVQVPPRHEPLVVPLARENVVEIVPVHKSAAKQRPWWMF